MIEICGCLLEDPQCLDLVIVFHPESVCGEMNNEETIYCFKRLHQNIHLKVHSIHLIFYTYIDNMTMKFRSPHGYLVHHFFNILRLYPEEIQITTYRTHL